MILVQYTIWSEVWKVSLNNAIISFINTFPAATPSIICFGVKCPPPSVMCVLKEKSQKLEGVPKVVEEVQCIGRGHEVLLRGGSVRPNPKDDVILNQYQFYGPGTYSKDRIDITRRNFFKRFRSPKLSLKRQLEDMRRKMTEDLAETLRGNIMKSL